MTFKELMKIRNNENNYSELCNLSNFVPFVGAGMSSSIYPLWHEFLESFELLDDERKTLQYFLDLGKYEEAATFIAEKNHTLFIRQVKATFKNSKIEYSKIQNATKKIFEITNDMIITTNLDEILETIWNANNKKFEAIITPNCEEQFNNAISSKTQNILIKLHGTVAESSQYILTAEQYNNHYGQISNNKIDTALSFVRDLLRCLDSRTILFLGSSLKSDRIIDILKYLHNKNNYINHYAFLPLEDYEEKSELNLLRERELAECGIVPIWYPINDYDSIEILIDNLKKNK